MHVELQATCSALGYQEGNKYVREPDCLETAKDLIRFLKREDDSCDIRRQLGHAQILQKDLVPILKQYKDETALFETVLRLMVNLTQPTILCFGNKLPADKAMRNHALEIDSHLQCYKEAFVDEELFAVLAEKVGNILQKDWETRQEEDKLLLERLLILIRNMLHIPPNPDLEQRTDDDASLHDQILWVIHVSGLEDMMLYIASSENERHLCMHLLEIVSLMFREQTADILACAGVQRSTSEKEKDERELQMIRQKERTEKKANMLKHSARHSRFGGTYVLANMKSISDRNLIYHKSQVDVENFSLDSNKKPRKKPKNRQPIKDKDVTRRSTLSIRLSLKEFCVQFLENAYNPLMHAVKDNLVRERTQEHDETYYMWAMRFFMEFCRHHSKRVELVGETLSVQTFHYIYTNLITYYEMIMTEKTEAVTWGKRVHLALKAYQELLLTVDMMDRSGNPQLMESSKVIKGNVFYMMEFRDIFVTLLKKFDQTKQSRTYLRDLVETTHLFMKMLEHFCKKTNHFVVQKKKKKTKKKAKPIRNAEEVEPTTQELEDLWDEISGQLSAIFQGRNEIPEVPPFDAASEVDVDQQRVDAMCRIQDAMRNRVPAEAVGIFRAAREVWPEREEFGSQEMRPEEEFMALREIFMAPLPKPRQQSESQSQYEEGEEEPAPPEEEEEVVEERVETVASEQEFDFTGFLVMFSKPPILKAYSVLLSDFETNSDHTNHCIVRMLHRVAVVLGFPAMVFQASIFRVFQKLLLGPYAVLPRFKEMVKFATYIIRRFVETAENNKKVFMELLFWKGSKESQEICQGYGSVSTGKSKVLWMEELEQELRRLFEEFRDVDHPEKDIGDLIMERLTDPSKTRGQVIRELKKQGLIAHAKDLKRATDSRSGRGGGLWREEEELLLTDLYHQFKHSDDVLGNILSNLQNKRSKPKVIEKLMSLGLVTDRKELYKRRKRKSKKDDDESDQRSDDSDDERFNEINNEDFVEGVSRPQLFDDSSSSEDDDGEEGSPSGDVSVADRLKILVEKGYQEQIAWIQRLLGRVTDDREEEDDCVSVPIVPLTEENETAMEDQLFLDFLKLIGISPPANEQEAFWRISANLSVSQLKDMRDGLELGPDGEPLAAYKIKPVVNKPKEKKAKRKTQKVSQTQSERKEEDKKKQEQKKKALDRKTALQTLAKQRKTNKRKRNKSDEKQNESDKENDDDDDPHEVVDDSPIRETTLKNRKKGSRLKKAVSSDSESDEEDKRLNETAPNAKRPKLFDSDSEDEVQQASPEKRTKLFNSDSSDEEIQKRDDPEIGGDNSKLYVTDEKDQAASETGEASIDGTEKAVSTIDDDSDSVSIASKKNRFVKSDSDSDSVSLSNKVKSQLAENKSKSSSTKKRTKKSRKQLTDSDEEPLVNKSSQKKSVKNIKPVSKQKQIVDPDEEQLTKSAKKTKKKDRIQSSEVEQKSVKAKKQIRENDSSSEDEPLSVSVGKKRIREEDSSSEDEPLSTSMGKKRIREEDSSSEDEPLSVSVGQKLQSKRARVEEDSAELSTLQLSISQSQDSPPVQNTNKLFNSDDSSDEEPLSKALQTKQNSLKSSETFPATLLTQAPGDSDSDIDDHIPLRRVVNKNVIESDDSD